MHTQTLKTNYLSEFLSIEAARSVAICGAKHLHEFGFQLGALRPRPNPDPQLLHGRCKIWLVRRLRKVPIEVGLVRQQSTLHFALLVCAIKIISGTGRPRLEGASTLVAGAWSRVRAAGRGCVVAGPSRGCGSLVAGAWSQARVAGPSRGCDQRVAGLFVLMLWYSQLLLTLYFDFSYLW
jgi:hypothetical protein